MLKNIKVAKKLKEVGKINDSIEVLKKSINSLTSNLQASRISNKSHSQGITQTESEEDQALHGAMLCELGSLYKIENMFDDARNYLLKARSMNVTDDVKEKIQSELEDIDEYIKNI